MFIKNAPKIQNKIIIYFVAVRKPSVKNIVKEADIFSDATEPGESSDLFSEPAARATTTTEKRVDKCIENIYITSLGISGKSLINN